MTQIELNNQLTTQLKDFIKVRDHIGTGKLYKSIKVTSDSNLKFSINAYEYIQYLDDGLFITDFFSLPKTILTIGTYVSQVLENELKIN